MATKLTKEQAKALLDAYEKQQTAATNASIAAYNKEVDADVKATETEIAAEKQKAQITADTVIDRAAVQALIERRQIAEAISNLGLSRSGVAASADESISRRRLVSENNATAAKRASLSALSQRLVTAREQAAAKKEKNAAAARKTLNSKIAEKKLTLDKATV